MPHISSAEDRQHETRDDRDSASEGRSNGGRPVFLEPHSAQILLRRGGTPRSFPLWTGALLEPLDATTPRPGSDLGLIVSGHNDEEIARAFSRREAFDYVPKPVDLAHLQSVIADAAATAPTS